MLETRGGSVPSDRLPPRVVPMTFTRIRRKQIPAFKLSELIESRCTEMYQTTLLGACFVLYDRIIMIVKGRLRTLNVFLVIVCSNNALNDNSNPYISTKHGLLNWIGFTPYMFVAWYKYITVQKLRLITRLQNTAFPQNRLQRENYTHGKLAASTVGACHFKVTLTALRPLKTCFGTLIHRKDSYLLR